MSWNSTSKDLDFEIGSGSLGFGLNAPGVGGAVDVPIFKKTTKAAIADNATINESNRAHEQTGQG